MITMMGILPPFTIGGAGFAVEVYFIVLHLQNDDPITLAYWVVRKHA